MAKRISNPLVDPNTGEVIDTSLFVELEPGDYVRTKAQQEFIRKKDARYQDKTDFVWLNFQYGTNLDFSVDKAVAVRLVYFGTACGSDGVIQKCKLMDANISLDKNQQTTFFKQALQSGLLRQEGSAFFINPQMMSWGEYLGDSDHIRIFLATTENFVSWPNLRRI